MVTVELTTDLDLVKEILTNRDLFYRSMPDEDILAYEQGTWYPSDIGWNYLLIKKDDLPVGIIRFQYITSTTADIHGHMLPQYWGTRAVPQAEQAMEDWFLANSYVYKLVIQTPKPCLHIVKFAAKSGFEIEGCLTGAILWRKKLEDLILLSKFIKRG